MATWEGLQETTQALERIEAFDPFSVRQTFRLTSITGDPESVLAVPVTPGLFPMLGLQPLLGRMLLPEDIGYRGCAKLDRWRDCGEAQNGVSERRVWPRW